MVYLGIDVHKGQWTICQMSQNGHVDYTRQIYGSWKECVRFVSNIPGAKAVTFEASCEMGWLYDRLSEVCDKVVVADPGQLAANFATKRKNDKIDARKLAKLLLVDLIPQAYVARRDTRAWRALIEYRRGRLAERTGIKGRIRALLRSQGKLAPKGLWSSAGRRWLEKLEFEVEADKARLVMLLEDLDAAEASQRRVTRELDGISLEDRRVKLLMTVPGVGVRTAEAFVAYVEEAGRFGRGKCVGSYFGFVPSQDQSGPTDRLGRITRRGPSVVRWLLVEAAWQGIRRSPRLWEMYGRILHGQPSRGKIAAVAVAHFLSRAMLAMLKSGQPWREAA